MIEVRENFSDDPNIIGQTVITSKPKLFTYGTAWNIYTRI